MTSLQIGTAIYEILIHNNSVVNLVNNKIFPIVVDDEKTTFPYIVYKRAGMIELSNKDLRGETQLVDILIASNTYSNSIDVAESVREAIEGYEGSVSEFYINDVILNYANEDYIDGVFTQTLRFEIKLN